MQPGKPVVFGQLPEAAASLPSFFWTARQSHLDAGDLSLLRRAFATGSGGSYFIGAAVCAGDADGRGCGQAGLTRIAACSSYHDRARPAVRMVGWQGSGDLAANARANCYASFRRREERFFRRCAYNLFPAVGLGPRLRAHGRNGSRTTTRRGRPTWSM